MHIVRVEIGQGALFVEVRSCVVRLAFGQRKKKVIGDYGKEKARARTRECIIALGHGILVSEAAAGSGNCSSIATVRLIGFDCVVDRCEKRRSPVRLPLPGEASSPAVPVTSGTTMSDGRALACRGRGIRRQNLCSSSRHDSDTSYRIRLLT